MAGGVDKRSAGEQIKAQLGTGWRVNGVRGAMQAKGHRICHEGVAGVLRAAGGGLSASRTVEDLLKTITLRAPAPRWRLNTPVGFIRSCEPALVTARLARPGCTR
jgi:hypothetical protein